MQPVDLLIRNGLVFDGLGSPPRTADVAVAGDRVVAISDTPIDAPAERTIDATGRWVVPGFLDTHTHYDAEVLASPGLPESVRHGVTTVVMGSCSLSTILSSVEDCADVFSRVEALPREHVLGALANTKTWSTAQGWIDALEARALGPNVAAFLGHSDLRVAVMGLGRAVDASERPSTDELATMERTLEASLDAGLLGLSTMTNPWDKVGGERYRSRKLPSAYATWGEYRRLHRILRRRDAILQSAPNITTKVNALLFLAESAGFGLRKPLKTTLITAADTKSNPLLCDAVTNGVGLWNAITAANVRWQSVPMPFEVYADGIDLVVFEEFGAGEEALHLKDAVARERLLSDPDYRRRFRSDYTARFSPRVWHRDFHDAEIVDCPDPTVVGRSFGDVADSRGVHPVDAFLDLVVAHGTDLRWRTTIANHRPEVLDRLIAHPTVQIGFADSGAHVRNMAFYNFPLVFLRAVLRSHARSQPLMSLEQAVHRVTGELGQWYGIDAGTLREGDRADIAVVDPDALDDTLDGYHEAPMPSMGGLVRMVRRNDAAVPATIVGGHLAWLDGAFAPAFGQRRMGRFLTSAQAAS